MRVFLKKQIEQYQRKIIRQIIDSNKSVIVTGKNSIGKTFIAKELFEILDDCVYVSGYPKEIRNLKNKKSIEILKSVDLSTFFCISDENYYVFSYLIALNESLNTCVSNTSIILLFFSFRPLFLLIEISNKLIEFLLQKSRHSSLYGIPLKSILLLTKITEDSSCPIILFLSFSFFMNKFCAKSKVLIDVESKNTK